MPLPLRNSRMKLSQGLIFWREVGFGEPALVFLHGSWSDSSQWVPAFERLSRHYHCVAPDLLGFGESDRPKVHYSIELEVECLAEYLEALNLRQVYLVGHSLGGWVAASYALKYLDQVRGLVLLSPEGVETPGFENRLHLSRWLLGGIPLWFSRWRWVHTLAKFLRVHKHLQRSLLWLQTRRLSPVACKLLFLRRRREIQAELLQERLSWLKVPLLILRGEDDTPTAAALSQAYASLAPTADLQIIPQGGPDLPLDLPDVVADRIRNFLQS